jgi:hypothetical protein
MLAVTGSHLLFWATVFPMVSAGGLFIMIVGVGVVSGAVFPNKRDLSLFVPLSWLLPRSLSLAGGLWLRLGTRQDFNSGFYSAQLHSKSFCFGLACRGTERPVSARRD